MALSLRGTAEAFAIDGGDITITHPVGIDEDDVVYLAYTLSTVSVGDFDMAITTSGYTELGEVYFEDTVPVNFAVFRKIMGITPDSTAVCDGNDVITDSLTAVEHVWTGVDIITPEDATTEITGGIDGSVPDSPPIITVTANAIVISFGGSSIGDISVDAPSGYSNQVDINSDDNRDSTCAAASILVVSPGTEDPGAWINWTDNNATCRGAATVAIRPAAGEAPVTPTLRIVQSAMQWEGGTE